MDCKLSLFNYIKECSNIKNNVFVFNTLSRKLVLLPTKMLGNLSTMKENTLKELKKNNILVDSKIDEIRDLKTQINIKRYASDKLMLTIIPTNACNFKCIYCYQPIRYDYMKKDVANNTLKWLAKNLRYYKEVNLNWFGGEPLVQKSQMCNLMVSISQLCKQKGVSMVASITTNGYLLDVKTFQRLVENGLLFYQITIDGPREVHNQQRPHKINDNSYDVIINNLIQISKLPSKMRFEIGVRINISGKMEEKDVIKFIDEMKKNFGHDKRFVFVWQWVRDWGGERIKSAAPQTLTKSSNDCLQYLQYASEQGLKSPSILSSTCGTDSCEAFYKNGYVINYDGKVFKCAMRMEDYESNCIGFIDDNGRMVLNENERMWLSDDVINEACLKCILLPICLTNRCHYSVKVKSELKCMECRDLLDSQINSMINDNKYLKVEV